MPAEYSEALDLPSFSDRLPDLLQALRQTGNNLKSASAKQSYLPYWEDLYTVAHSIKGVLKILKSPASIADFVLELNEMLLEGLAGKSVCRKIQEAGEIFCKMSEALDIEDLENADAKALKKLLGDFRALYSPDQKHEERLKEIPAHLFYVNEFVSKKAREITLLGLNQCAVEEEILLDEIPLWRTQLNEALISEEFGRGLVVNFLPFLSPEGSRKLKVWAWVAAATHNRAALKQRIKEFLPKVTIAKL